MKGAQRFEGVLVAVPKIQGAGTERTTILSIIIHRAVGHVGPESALHGRSHCDRISVSKMLARIRRQIAAVDTQGGNRMRESCTYGSVRGVRGNSHPYCDCHLLQCMSPLLAVRPEGANHQWRKNPPGELSIARRSKRLRNWRRGGDLGSPRLHVNRCRLHVNRCPPG
jgi:hypothetical protein